MKSSKEAEAAKAATGGKRPTAKKDAAKKNAAKKNAAALSAALRANLARRKARGRTRDPAQRSGPGGDGKDGDSEG